MPRLDVYLVDQGICQSRHQAKMWIENGEIMVNGQITTKASTKIGHQAVSRISGQATYVSRGGHKLAFALHHFNIDLEGLICADIGASTGGFTDVCIQNGAQKVYAIDVGSDQLHPSLRQNDNIVVMEGTNIRNLSSLPEPIDFLCCDVSFCSLSLILPPIFALKPNRAILLIKPQFEVGPQAIRKGRVHKESDRLKALSEIQNQAMAIGFEVVGSCPSPIHGAKKGNIEYLLMLRLPS